MSLDPKVEEIIKSGDQDALYELRMWLFKESCRLENQQSDVDEKMERIQEEQERFRIEAENMKRDIKAQEQKLRKDASLFDQKLQVLKRGFDELNEDRKKFERDKAFLDKEKKYNEQAMYEGVDILFRGANNPLALKKRYKDLMKIYHPDNMDGDDEIVLMINAEYSKLQMQYENYKKA